MSRSVKFVIIVSLIAAIVAVFAVNKSGVCCKGDKPACCHFVDADGDGICDNVGKSCCKAKCKEFVDANNDGKCDNCGLMMKGGKDCENKQNKEKGRCCKFD